MRFFSSLIVAAAALLAGTANAHAMHHAHAVLALVPRQDSAATPTQYTTATTTYTVTSTVLNVIQTATMTYNGTETTPPPISSSATAMPYPYGSGSNSTAASGTGYFSTSSVNPTAYPSGIVPASPNGAASLGVDSLAYLAAAGLVSVFVVGV